MTDTDQPSEVEGKQESPMSKFLDFAKKTERKHIIIGAAVGVPVLFLFTTCMCCGALGILGGRGDSTVRDTPPEQVIEVSASQLFSEYRANDIAGDQKYKGKIVKVSGSIDSISRDILDNIYVTLKSGGQFELFHIQCFFSDDQVKRAAELSPGQYITIQGRCDGKFGNVMVKDCIFID